MRILQALTYYRPHISGLTIYVERLSHRLAEIGHKVTVLTSQYDPTLPLREQRDGVQIVRAPVIARVSKGVIMPTFGILLRRLLPDHDVLHIHLPQFDGAGLAINARLYRKPSLLTYHCDVRLPDSIINRVAQPVIVAANHLAGSLVQRVVAYTEDYAKHSPFLSRYLHKLEVIPPPIEITQPTAEDVAAFRRKWRIGDELVIGMAARLATEKGVEVLVNALEIIHRSNPSARVIFAGPHQHVLGEEAYAAWLQPRFTALGDQWTFTGALNGRELAAFFAASTVTVLPSLNSTESFGLVQVESMLCGTPVVCSDLPGVRVPVQRTGMGKVVPVGDPQALAKAILEVAHNRARFVQPRDRIATLFSTEQSADAYNRLYAQLMQAQHPKGDKGKHEQ